METNKSSFIKGHYRQSIASRTLEKTKLTWPEFFGCIVKQSPVSFPSVWPLPNFGSGEIGRSFFQSNPEILFVICSLFSQTKNSNK